MPYVFVWWQWGAKWYEAEWEFLYDVNPVPGNWYTFRLQRGGYDNWTAFIVGQILHTFYGTGISSSYPCTGAERSRSDDDNRGSFKNLKYKHWNTAEWYWWPKSAEWADYDEDFEYYDRTGTNHWGYVDRE